MDEETFKKREQAARDQIYKYAKARGGISKGEEALQALESYQSCLLPPPEWAIRTLRECWHIYKEGHGFTSFDNEHGHAFTEIKAHKTFDEVLGLKPRSLNTLKKELDQKALPPMVHSVFKRMIEEEGAKLDNEGILWGDVAKELDISSGGKAQKLYEYSINNLGMAPVKGRHRPRK
jgi:hypothetical protein